MTTEPPEVKLGDWITVSRKRGVLCQLPREGRAEFVYLDERNRAINEEIVWTGEKWEFAYPGVSGGYADNYPRLADFVSVLRSGERRS